MSAILILTTAGSREEAKNIAQSLVESRLAACVNILPKMESVYRWEDNVQNAEEWLLLVKTQSSRFEAVSEAIKALHSYDLPECIAIEVSDSTKLFLDWIRDTTA